MRILFTITAALCCLFGAAQVNLQTGGAVQNFPLIDYSDIKSGLSLGVTLNYNSGNGLLVGDIASDAGTGWNLDAGGMIMRIQVGQPDDQKAYFTGNVTGMGSLQNYPDGFMYNPHIGKGCNVGGNYYPVFQKQNNNAATMVYKDHNIVTGDTEQDKFVFKFGNRYGVFVISRNLGNDTWKVTTLGDSRMKIGFTTADMTSQGIRSRINKFTVTTEDGLQYSFAALGITKLCRYRHSTVNGYGQFTPVDKPDDGPNVLNRFYGYELAAFERPNVVNNWYLSEIKNTNNGSAITFNYKSVQHDLVTGKNITHLRDLNSSCGHTAINKKNECGRRLFEMLSNPVTANAYCWDINLLGKLSPGPTNLMYIRSIMTAQRLMSINLPNGGQISFVYDGFERADLPGGNALKTVSYVLNGKLIRGYQLEYGYFFKNTIRPYRYDYTPFEKKFTRLCLLSLQKMGTGEDEATEPPYKFDYYTGSTKTADNIVPARNFLNQDHWGYFNGNISGINLTEDHDFFTYEHPYFKSVLAVNKNVKPGYAQNGLLKTVQYPTNGKLTYEYAQNMAAGNVVPGQYTQYAGGVSVQKTTLTEPADPGKVIATQYNYKKANGSSSHWGDEAPIYYSLNVTEYNEKWFNKKFKYPGIQYPEMMATPDTWKMLAGMALGAGIGYGVNAVLAAILPAQALPVVNIILTVATIIKYVFDATKTYEFHRFTLSNQNYTLYNPLSSLYSRVEVSAASPEGYNGKTVYEFTDNNDYALLVPNYGWPFMNNQRQAGWLYGLPKKVTVYDKDDKVTTLTRNEYTTYLAKAANADNLNCNCATQNKRSLNSFDWSDGAETWFSNNTYHWMTPRPYYQQTGRSDFSYSAVENYKDGNLYYTSTTQVITDPATLLPRSKILRKDVQSITMEVNYYATDFNLPGAITQLKQNNAIHTPVSTEIWELDLKPNGSISMSNMRLLDATVTEYKQYNYAGRTEVKPWKTYTLKTKTPVAQSVIGMHNPNVLIRKPEYYQLTNEMIYDGDGNLTETRGFDNNNLFINDYKNRYVVATISNASYADIAYCGFEADGKGNWNFNPVFTKVNQGIAGFNALKLGADAGQATPCTVTKTGLNNSIAYYVTYWVKDGAAAPVTVNNEPGTLLTEANGWKCYRHEVTNASTITVSGDGLIDELRLYPKGLLMTTVSYKDGVGKITECDANNRMLFYEYDGLNRIKLVRDQNRNIIKTYEYNFAR
jgi:hypothetical protein